MKIDALKTGDHLQLLEDLSASGTLIIGPMTQLTDDSQSPVSVDMHEEIWHYPKQLAGLGLLFAKLIMDTVPADHPGRVLACGIPETANSLAITTVMVADMRYGRSVGLIPMRSKPKRQAVYSKLYIVSSYEKGDMVFLIDDVVTSAAVQRQAIEKLLAMGFPKESIVVTVAFDTQQGGLQLLEKDGCQTTALFRILDVAKTFNDQGLIEDRDWVAVQGFIGSHQFNE